MKIKLTECARPECANMIPEHSPGTPGRRREYCSNSCRTVTWNRAARLRRRIARENRDRLWREALEGISP